MKKSMEPSIDELKENYKRFSDDRLIKLATLQAASLRPEAIQVMNEEITRRGLASQVGEGIEVQLKPVTPGELSGYCNLLESLPCPVCGRSSQKLNAIMTGTVKSFLIITNYEKKILIACPDCLSKANRKAMLTTMALGWWGVPWGIIRTVQALILNNKMRSLISIPGPGDLFKDFVRRRVGAIEANKNNPEGMRDLIKL